MNKNILIVIAVAVLGAGAYVYLGRGDQTMVVDDMHAAKEMKAGLMKESGREDMDMSVVLTSGHIMLAQDGKTNSITGDYVFPTGTKVNAMGMVTRVDGTTFQLKEGQSVWPDGMTMDVIAKDDAMMKGKDTMMHDGGMMKTGDGMMMHGSYIPYDASKLMLAKTGKVVLFFRASWCPTCRALDRDIRANMNDIPANVTILDVDYDSSKDLKVKYGVTYQHTMVEVDADGTLIKKWSGSETLAALVSGIK